MECAFGGLQRCRIFICSGHAFWYMTLDIWHWYAFDIDMLWHLTIDIGHRNWMTWHSVMILAQTYLIFFDGFWGNISNLKTFSHSVSWWTILLAHLKMSLSAEFVWLHCCFLQHSNASYSTLLHTLQIFDIFVYFALVPSHALGASTSRAATLLC